MTRRPDWLEWLIIQNTNAYEIGFTAVWDGLRGADWQSRTPETEKPLEAFLQADTVKLVYTHGHPKPELINPDNWNMDLHFLDRPNARRVQLDFFYDYRTNVALYPQWQEFLREQQPKTIIFWGQDDVFFTREGGEAYLKDLPNAENAPVEFRSRRGRGLLDHDRREDNGLLQEDSNGVTYCS